MEKIFRSSWLLRGQESLVRELADAFACRHSGRNCDSHQYPLADILLFDLFSRHFKFPNRLAPASRHRSKN